MASLRPPSSPSPSPLNTENGRADARASLGARQTLAPSSPRPGGIRPTSELLGSATAFQTPESEAIDQWFENLQNYEDTLEDMAAASMDVNFKEELSAIEQWFKVLSEAERTAALYSLLQQSTQVQIRFFITVLQQMARSDPMTALLSPAVGGSMQGQMEAKLAQMSLKSPGLQSKMPSSPRVFSGGQNRQSLALDNNSNYLSPDSAAVGGDAAATLAQQRAKLKASNAAHRISAPILASSGEGRSAWGSALSQVAENNPNSPAQEIVIPSGSSSARPKSTEFSGSLGSGRTGADGLSPMVGDSWASNVNTPLIPMFNKDAQSQQNLDAAAQKLSDWNQPPRVPLMADPKTFRRASKGSTTGGSDNGRPSGNSNVHDDGNNQQAQRRNVGQGSNGQTGAWNAPARSPGLPPNRFGGDDANGLNGLGMGGFSMNGLSSPGIGMGMPPSAGLLAGMNPMQMNMLNLQAQMNAMGLQGMTPEAQMLAAQMAAGFQSPGGWMGMQNGLNSAGANRGRGAGGGGGRSPGMPKSATGSSSGAGAKKDEEDFDPSLLGDIPAWLRSLRLHKYTPNFEHMNWKDVVALDDAGLEAKGVAALGARRKMLKTFEVVRKKMGVEDGSEGPREA
ncbi:hypothetical protein CONPUDRAFT_104262 [Coniophora puteana RWD-64-598 SS2]|uniref:RNA-binding protein VTS1 n=1 Tax=Coniophora puteana (strain RWD-64-598) TaxID=741705 RepID=A0A5M3MPT5_CONPW|nr:uncharacterized protein CONPUDRAFT_104262 [Coniophora puteana RWD-64-598 SS2]EIW81090.1 hypothetical protein CONPUDRAFT_104262 [Coniophora puteana RWD-64-598 SS2]